MVPCSVPFFLEVLIYTRRSHGTWTLDGETESGPSSDHRVTGFSWSLDVTRTLDHPDGVAFSSPTGVLKSFRKSGVETRGRNGDGTVSRSSIFGGNKERPNTVGGWFHWPRKPDLHHHYKMSTFVMTVLYLDTLWRQWPRDTKVFF